MYTTVEQAKHLLELGVDPKTHDMYWNTVCDDLHSEWYKKIYVGKEASIMNGLFSFKNGYTVPAWSLQGLLSLIQTIRVNKVTGITRMYHPVLSARDENDWVCYLKWGSDIIAIKTGVDMFSVVYDMVCFVYENKDEFNLD